MRYAIRDTRCAICVLLALLLSACAPATPTAPAQNPLQGLTPVPSPAPARELRVLLPEWPQTLTPSGARSWSEYVLRGLFLVGLWRVDDRLGVTPELAEGLPTRSSGISADGRVLTVRLRENLFWSDGTPLTADDLVFTHEWAAAQGLFPHASFVQEIVALDDRTVQVLFTRPFAPWPTMLFPFVLPRHAPDRAGWVGNGPYVFAGEEGGALVFVANPYYWRGQPAIGRVRVFAQPDAQARWQVMAFGDADLAPFLAPGGPPGSAPPEGMSLLFSPSGYVETLFFNLDPRRGHPALQEPRVRAALATALERSSICAALTAGRAVPAGSLYSGTVWESADLESAPSLRRAAQMLDEVGWWDANGDGIREREGVPLTLRYAVPPGREAAQAVVARTLRELGVGVETVVRERPWEDPAAWDLAQWAGQPSGYPDPDDARWLCAEARPGGQNPAGVCDEALDELWQAQAAATDPEERAAILAEIQEKARRAVWWVPLCRWEDAWLVRSDLYGPRLWRGAPFWNIGEWR